MANKDKEYYRSYVSGLFGIQFINGGSPITANCDVEDKEPKSYFYHAYIGKHVYVSLGIMLKSKDIFAITLGCDNRWNNENAAFIGKLIHSLEINDDIKELQSENSRMQKIIDKFGAKEKDYEKRIGLLKDSIRDTDTDFSVAQGKVDLLKEIVLKSIHPGN